MDTDIHIRLTDEEAAALRYLADRDERSITATARLLLRPALARAMRSVKPLQIVNPQQ